MQIVCFEDQLKSGFPVFIKSKIKKILIIRLEFYLSVVLQYLMKLFQENSGRKPPVRVSCFRSGVGKIQKYTVNAFFRKIIQDITCVHTYKMQVPGLFFLRKTVQSSGCFYHHAFIHLYPYEIRVRI